MRRAFRSLTTWLVLVAGLLSAVAPTQGLVVCYESDGTATVELAAARCAGCPETGTETAPTGKSAPELASCACTDVPLTSANQPPAKPRLGDRGAAIALAPAPLVASDALGSDARALSPRATPIGDRARLETVVLRL